MNKVAVCIIYDKSDNQYLTNCLHSIPPEIDVICMETIPNKNKLYCGKNTINPIKNNEYNILNKPENITFYQWNYYCPTDEKYNYELNRFSFSEARNVCKSLTDADIIINLDADEEIVLNGTEYASLLKLDQKIGIVYTTIYSKIADSNNESGYLHSFGKNPRIHRKEIDWKYRIHEQITDRAIELGYQRAYSSILIKHNGYYDPSQERMRHKYLRNLAMLCDELIIDVKDYYIKANIFETLKDMLKYDMFHVEQFIDKIDIAKFNQSLTQYGVSVIYQMEVLFDNMIASAYALRKNPKNNIQLENMLKYLYIFNTIIPLELQR
jgi:hypothetical protein